MSELIAFTGKIGSGKSYAAQHLVKQGFKLHKFAKPLKDMLRAIGLTDQHIEGNLKEVPHELLCNQTPRYAMQTLGTEWGRDCIDEDFWVSLWSATLPELAVCDDCRFKNEAGAVRRHGGLIIELRTLEPVDKTEGEDRTFAHTSEDMTGIIPDAVVYNTFKPRFLDNIEDVLLALRTGEKL